MRYEKSIPPGTAFSNPSVSLTAGAKAIRRQASFLGLILREKAIRGNVGNLLLLFHVPTRRRGGGNGVVCGFQGLWITRQTCLWFPPYPAGRHFQGPPFSCAPRRVQAAGQLPLGRRHRFGSCGVAVPQCGLVHGCDAPLGREISRHTGPARELLPRRRLPALHSLRFSWGAEQQLRLSAPPLKGEIGIEIFRIESFHRSGMLAADRQVALGLRPTAPFLDGARPWWLDGRGHDSGRFNPWSVQELGDSRMDKLTAVVGVEAAKAKRKLLQPGLPDRNQPGLPDLRNSHHPPLRHFIDRGDGIHALVPLGISRRDSVHAPLSGPALGLRRPSLCNRPRSGLGRHG